MDEIAIREGLTPAEQAVHDIVAQGPDRMSELVDAHAKSLVAAGDIAGLAAFTRALIEFSQQARGAR